MRPRVRPLLFAMGLLLLGYVSTVFATGRAGGFSEAVEAELMEVRLARLPKRRATAPGFSAWITRDGDCRFGYVHTGRTPVVLSVYPAGYAVSSSDEPEFNGCYLRKFRRQEKKDWVLLKPGEHVEWEMALIRNRPDPRLDPRYSYTVHVYGSDERTLPKSMRGIPQVGLEGTGIEVQGR